MSSLALWGLVLMLIVLHALLAAFESALHGVSMAGVVELAQGGSKRAKRVAALKADPQATTAAMWLGLILIGFTAVALAVPAAARAVAHWTDPGAEQMTLSTLLVTLLSAGLVSLLVISADLVARSAAVQAPQSTALALSSVGAAAFWALRPMVRVWAKALNVSLRPFGRRVSFESALPSLEELERSLIRKAQLAEIDKGAPQLIRRIFALSKKTCDDLMVPRTEIVAIDISTPIAEILELIAEENHSRIPVYRDEVDRIVGILHVRDLVPMLQHPELIVLQDVVRPAEFVPWMKRIGDLLRDMQRHRIHLAIVVDEYGGLVGIITLEDILQEIVGPIHDEFEEFEKPVERQPDDSFLVDATIPVADFSTAFDFRFPAGDFETLGGFLSHLAGSIPETLDRFIHNGWVFVVQAKVGPRLERIRVFKPKVVLERRPASGGSVESTKA